jgi:MFS superfamily sulfate permease-like transporter
VKIGLSARTGVGSVLRVDGPVTFEETDQWRDSLLAALAGPSDLRLDMGASGPWDVAGLQLILSALATATKAGKSLTLDRVTEAFLSVAESAGASEVLAGSIIGRDV